MQSSQRIATEMPSAINSLVLTSSACGADAACASPENAFITFGVSPRIVRISALKSSVRCAQFLIIGQNPPFGGKVRRTQQPAEDRSQSRVKQTRTSPIGSTAWTKDGSSESSI